MEISLIGSSSQIGTVKTDLSAIRNLGFSKFESGRRNQVLFQLKRNWNNARIHVSANSSMAVVDSHASGEELSAAIAQKCLPEEGVQLFVGLPIDAVSDCNTINHARAITAGLKALKLLGCEGVEIPVWWGIVEKEAMGKYEWSGYLAVAKMVQSVGLKLRVSISFHGSEDMKVPLPQWISKIGESNPDIFFTNKAGERYKECLSFGVDEVAVLDGKSPMEVYEGFLESFKSKFSDFIGSTITEVTVGLGPNGELRYPSYPSEKLGEISGAGEFHCYDKHMLSDLTSHAQEMGNANWGLGGPHDAPSCNDSPVSNGFFKDNGGSWETPYGNFFLSWYSSYMLLHGERLLSITSRIFGDSSVNLSGKIPLIPSWYKMKSHPAEMTAGFYNANNRDGYDDVAQVFARNSCKMILPGMELSDKFQPEGLLSSPGSLFSQIKTACKRHDVEVYGENLNIAGAQNGMDEIKHNLIGDGVTVDLFTYQRMGAYFFSPEHFPIFSEFVRSLNQYELDSDDMLENERGSRSSLCNVSEDRQMQEA